MPAVIIQQHVILWDQKGNSKDTYMYMVFEILIYYVNMLDLANSVGHNHWQI